MKKKTQTKKSGNRKKRTGKIVIFIVIIAITGTVLYWNRDFLTFMRKGYTQDNIKELLKETNKEEYLTLDYKIDIDSWNEIKNNGNYYDYDLYEKQQEENPETIVEKVDFIYENMNALNDLGYSKDYIRENYSTFTLDNWKAILENDIQYKEVTAYIKVKNSIISDIPSYTSSGLEPLEAVMSISYPFINSEISPGQIYQIEDPDTITILVKYGFRLPDGYEPSDLVETNLPTTSEETKTLLRKEASDALMNMASDASKEGLTIGIRSAYRSYADQESVYYYYADLNGEDYARAYVALPGYSEHQTGLSVDLTSQSVINGEIETFGETAEYNWVVENGYKYGFILRYPEDKTNITGAANEPWHFRYVGVDAATTMFNENLTLEEYTQRYGFNYSVSVMGD